MDKLEDANARIVELEELNKNLQEENGNLKKDIEEKAERITSLQEHNQKLFLKITEPKAQDDEPKGKTEDEQLDDLCKDWKM